MNKITTGIQLIKNMGLRYLFFRISHLIAVKSGILKKKFPVRPHSVALISLEEWKNKLPPFFFYGKNPVGLQRQKSDRLEKVFTDLSSGTVTFFGITKFPLGEDFDWITNPVTKFKYDINKHWSLINDRSEKEGDIKFVWEKARFSFLYDLIRYDYHYNIDCAELAFSEINSFIDKNPVNQGPNYICSQEISLRILNWTFALYYYKDSDYLTEALFQKIMNAIYWQIHHVYHNIRFSRIAVRNNHALTETLLLYLSGLLFPFLPYVKNWSMKGKRWFEKEIGYQVYEDGTYLQFSNNYHRVVVQLLTWGFRLAELNNEKFNPEVYNRAEKSLDFLYNSMDLSSGMPPDYGANDGALFFKLNDQEFRDFRPQLQALSYTLDIQVKDNFGGFTGEDIFWLGFSQNHTSQVRRLQCNSLSSYPTGGFYIARDKDSMTYVRCGKHKDRPSHADNLHLDIWYKGINYFRDNGSYLYNTEYELLKYFMGTRSHNTVMLEDFDQMLKGPRFTWFNWSQACDAVLKEFDDRFEFEGTIVAFSYLSKSIMHNRKIIKIKDVPKWIVEDDLTGTEKYMKHQLWHFNPMKENFIHIKACDAEGKSLTREVKEGWNSPYYGVKERSGYWQYSTAESKIITEIEILE